MRQELRAQQKDIHEALTLLGYRSCREDGSQWRRQRFHIILRQKKHKLILHLHEDLPSLYPPFHKACYTGKRVEEEMHKLLSAYKKR